MHVLPHNGQVAVGLLSVFTDCPALTRQCAVTARVWAALRDAMQALNLERQRLTSSWGSGIAHALSLAFSGLEQLKHR